jgi:hypothetical protein
MKHIKLFENFILESANTNLELKSIFKSLVNELKKLNLKVKFEYRKFDSDGDFDKFVPSKNLYDGGMFNAYLVMNDDDKNPFTKLFFDYAIDKRQSKDYAEKVKNTIETSKDKDGNLIFDKLSCEVFDGMSIGLLIKPKSSINKTEREYSMDANKFMGLKRTPVESGVSYLVGSGYEYLGDNVEKTREFQLIKIDDNSKTVEINKGLVSELSNSNKKDKLVNIAKEFAKKNGYKYNAISNSFV